MVAEPILEQVPVVQLIKDSADQLLFIGVVVNILEALVEELVVLDLLV